MRTATRPRGVTLIEVAVHSSLLLIVLGIAYAGLVLSQKYYRHSEASVRVQEQALLAVRRMVAEMGGSPAAGVTSDANGLVFVTARDAQGRVSYDSTSGECLWQGVVCYYLDSGSLCRKERPLTPSTTLPSPLPGPAEIRDDSSLAFEVAARNIETLQFGAGEPFTLSVRTSTDDFGGSSVDLSGSVAFRY